MRAYAVFDMVRGKILGLHQDKYEATRDACVLVDEAWPNKPRFETIPLDVVILGLWGITDAQGKFVCTDTGYQLIYPTWEDARSQAQSLMQSDGVQYGVAYIPTYECTDAPTSGRGMDFPTGERT
jgi:hypothetical protein